MCSIWHSVLGTVHMSIKWHILSNELANAAQDSKQLSGDNSEEEEVGRSGAFGPRKSHLDQECVTAQHQQAHKKKGKRQKAADKSQL